MNMNPSNSPPNLSDVAQIITQQQDFNGMMMNKLIETMSLLMDKKKSKPMTINDFDGHSEEALTWMTVFERTCEANGWDSDEMKINNLKSCLTLGSIADKWFSSRIIENVEETWTEWKNSFLTAFSQNKIYAAQQAIRYEYQEGSLMDFYYEKERLLKLAFPDLGQSSFITLVMLGLPSHLLGPLMSMDPQTKSDLILSLQKLPARQRKDITGQD